jgi:hypothetical protein
LCDKWRGQGYQSVREDSRQADRMQKSSDLMPRQGAKTPRLFLFYFASSGLCVMNPPRLCVINAVS